MTTNAERQQKTRERRKERIVSLEGLVAAFARMHITIEEVDGADAGKRRFEVSLEAPPEVHEALRRYCEDQRIGVADYLADIATEHVLTAARK